MVARTLATWKASDGSVDVQVCNPSSEHVVLPAELIIARLSPVNVTTREATHVHAIAQSSETNREPSPTADELMTVLAQLDAPLQPAFQNTAFPPLNRRK